MEITFNQLQEAFVNGFISLEQFIEVMTDNFGRVTTRESLKKIIKKSKVLERRERFKQSKTKDLSSIRL